MKKEADRFREYIRRGESVFCESFAKLRGVRSTLLFCYRNDLIALIRRSIPVT